MRSLFAVFVSLLLISSADARPRHHQAHVNISQGIIICNQQGCSDRPVFGEVQTRRERIAASYDDGRIVDHPAGCPRLAFCGCGVSVWAFGHSDRSLWPAAAYYRFPRSSPAAGNVAVWRHHVAGIISVNSDGSALLYDPNSGGHLTRIHVRSLAGATIVDPHGQRLASIHREYPAPN